MVYLNVETPLGHTFTYNYVFDRVPSGNDVAGPQYLSQETGECDVTVVLRVVPSKKLYGKVDH